MNLQKQLCHLFDTRMSCQGIAYRSPQFIWISPDLFMSIAMFAVVVYRPLYRGIYPLDHDFFCENQN